MRLFALNASREFGERLAAALGRPLDAHEEREFEDGEHKARPLASVRGETVYVLQSLHGDAQASGDDKLVRLLFFCGALRDHGAARVTALVPYLAYGRKERQTKPFDPVSTRYLAQLVEAVGVDALVTLETHSVLPARRRSPPRGRSSSSHPIRAASSGRSSSANCWARASADRSGWPSSRSGAAPAR